MGVVVLATGIARPSSWPLSHGARRLADRAARSCLRRAGRAADDVDLLINAGVYRERGLGEPALAALIQQDVEVNAGALVAGQHGTFSFDVDNGACGVVTAIDLMRGFLTSGGIELGMVVASDSGPGPLQARAMPFAESGGAILLGFDDTAAGFSAARLTTYPEYAGLLEGYWSWRSARLRLPGRPAGRNRLAVHRRPGFVARAVDCAAESVAKQLADLGVSPDEIDLLIVTPETGLADLLADRLGVRRNRVLHVGERLGRTHTAQPIAAIDLALHTGRWHAADTILLVSVGSGLTVGSTLYRT